MKLRDIMDASGVSYLSGVSSKKRLLQSVSEQAAQICNLDSRDVFTALQDREHLGSTGVGRGVAIPHARFESIDKVFGFFTRLDTPISFDAVDKAPVDLVFTLLAPKAEGAEHLKALALVSRTLRSESLCSTLRANKSQDALYSLLTEVNSTAAA